MPAHVAFFRAINLGARRKFPKDAIVAATQAAGGTDVATHINTGNVFLRTPLRSAARVTAALEAAYLADRGFEVPVVVLSPAELADVAATAARLEAERPTPGRHYVELLRDGPDPDLTADLLALASPGRTLHVTPRALHLLVDDDVAAGTGALLPAPLTRRLGTTTNRAATVIAQVAARWA